MGWGDLGVQRLAEPTSDWTRGCWVMGCEFVNIPMGIKSVMLAKNCNYTRISADAFGAAPATPAFRCRYRLPALTLQGSPPAHLVRHP